MAEQIEVDFDQISGDPRGLEIKYCPYCRQEIRSWKKALISTAVASLCQLVSQYRGEAIHHDDFTVLLKDRNFSQLKLWGLIKAAENDDPRKRASGCWHPTGKGIAFANERLLVHKYVVTQNNNILRFEGPLIGVREALGMRFDYQELMRNQ